MSPKKNVTRKILWNEGCLLASWLCYCHSLLRATMMVLPNSAMQCWISMVRSELLKLTLSHYAAVNLTDHMELWILITFKNIQTTYYYLFLLSSTMIDRNVSKQSLKIHLSSLTIAMYIGWKASNNRLEHGVSYCTFNPVFVDDPKYIVHTHSERLQKGSLYVKAEFSISSALQSNHW